MKELETEVKTLIRLCAASSWKAEDLDDDLPITGGGLGLDSVRLVELFCKCEDHFGVRLPLENLEGTTLTVGAFVGLVERARSGGDAPPSSAED